MLRFIFAAFGVDPWSLSNAVAQLAAFVGVPLEVVQGKYGPGLADLYQPGASVLGGVRVRGLASSTGFAQVWSAVPQGLWYAPLEE
jgi:hypothetical protein